jgi:hypothetical protein
VRPRDSRDPTSPQIGDRGQAVISQLVAAICDLERCGPDTDGFALWISTRPGHLLCGFCYRAAQVLSEELRCANPVGDPDLNAVVIAKLSEYLGVHIYLCGACAQADLS